MKSIPSTPTNGARFYKCALQVNPCHYAQKYQGQKQSDAPNRFYPILLKKCEELGIHIIAITDHNEVGSIELIKKEANGTGIWIFPGFEIESSEGIHVLCLYNPDTREDQLRHFLGELGIMNTDQQQLSKKSFSDILNTVQGQGGVTIAAHVTGDKGILKTLSGQARINAWKNKNLLAVQIPGSVKDLPVEYRPIVQNKDPAYKRELPAGIDLALAVVNAKDITTPVDLQDPSATCWIKMSQVTVEGLRQAFLDPSSRIRLASDPSPEEHTELISIQWDGGFLNGTTIRLNENLNILIGGRGTGKSTIIESLRYALGLEPLGEEASKTHEGIIRHVLRSGTKISVLLRSYTPNQKDYLIERTIPNPSIVREPESSKVLPIKPVDIIPRLEVYGQHEISELTRSPEKLTHLLKRFIQQDESAERRKKELEHKLKSSRQRALEVQNELKRVEELLSSLPSLEEMLKRFQEAGLEEKLKEQSLLVGEERIIKTAYERLQPLQGILVDFSRELPIDRAFVSERALEKFSGKSILSQINGILEKLSSDLEKTTAQMNSMLESTKQNLDIVNKQWQERKKQIQEEYEKILRELQKTKVDPEEFLRLRRQIEELRPLRDRQASQKREGTELAQRRNQLLSEWENFKTSEYREFEQAAKRVSKGLLNFVKVEVIFEGNREPLFDLLREQIGGRLSEAVDILKRQEQLSVVKLAQACREGKEALIKEFKLPNSQAERIAQANPETFMLIEELYLPPTTTIKLNIAPEGQEPSWQALDDLSTGQKATAVLLLLLLESNAPLVIDQPEDDLDNRFITEGIVPKMREEKRRRQFIFSTHNANIPVLGDAELIIGLTASGEGTGQATILPEHIGSIDTTSVRELVEEVLEGGREAFELRRLKYGF